MAMRKMLPLMVWISIMLMPLPLIGAMGPDPDRDPPTRGDLLVVGPGPGNYSTIQSAVDAASDGDSIFITAGTYNESVTVNVSVEIFGEDNKTIWRPKSFDHCIRIVKTAMVRNIKFIPGGFESIGIIIENADNTVIERCHIGSGRYAINVSGSDNVTLSSNGIHGTIEGITFTHSNGCLFTNNSFNGSAANLLLIYSSNNIIKNNHFHSFGPPIFFNGIRNYQSSNNNTIINNTFEGLSIESINIGAVSGVKILDNLIKNSYKGIVCRGSQDVEIQNCTIEGLTKNGSYFNNIVLDDVSSCNIRACHISGSNFGLNISKSQYVTVSDTVFIDNKNEAINIQKGSSVVSNYCTFFNNSFVFNNGATTSFNASHVQAFSDPSGTNQWSKDGYGNYWSDWTSPDDDKDGIVDLPYALTVVNDRYPLTRSRIRGPPMILTQPDPQVRVGDHYRVEFRSFDMDSPEEDLIWSLSTDATWLSLSKNVLSGSPLHKDVGKFQVLITLTDGVQKDELNYTLTVLPNEISPVILTEDLTECYEDMEYRVDYDADSITTVTWYLQTDASFLSMNGSSGVLSGIPRNKDVGKHNVTVIASDGELSDSTSFVLTVWNVNDPPEMGSGDPSSEIVYDPVLRRYVLKKIDLYCTQDTPFSFHFNATDPDPTRDQLVWTKTRGPDFLKISYNNSDMGAGTFSQMVLSGKAGNEDVGKHVVIINISDGNGGEVSTTFNLIVINVNDPPYITTADVTKGKKNELYSVEYRAVDIDPTNDTLTWSLRTNGSFLSMSSSTGILNGTLLRAGQFWVNVSVSDGKGGTDHSNFTLRVQDNNSRPMSTGSVLMLEFDENSVMEPIYLRTLIIDPDGDPLTFEALGSPNLSVHIDEEDRLFIEPKSYWAGNEFVTIIASDGRETFILYLPVTVRNINDPPRIIDIIMPDAFKEGIEIVLRAEAFDPDLVYGDVLSYRWSIQGMGEVGTGEELRIRLGKGTYVLTLEITDLGGETIERTMTFDVEGSGKAHLPQLAVIAIVLLTILMLIAVSGYLIIMRRRRDEEQDRENSRGDNDIRSGTLGDNSLWDRIESDADMELSDVYGELFLRDAGFRSSMGMAKDRIKIEYEDDNIAREDYLGLMRVLERIED